MVIIVILIKRRRAKGKQEDGDEMKEPGEDNEKSTPDYYADAPTGHLTSNPFRVREINTIHIIQSYYIVRNLSHSRILSRLLHKRETSESDSCGKIKTILSQQNSNTESPRKCHL